MTIDLQQYTTNKRLTIDSVTLKSNERLKIGSCINCSTPYTVDIDFAAIGIFNAQGHLKLMRKADLINFLETNDKEDCITYILQKER